MGEVCWSHSGWVTIKFQKKSLIFGKTVSHFRLPLPVGGRSLWSLRPNRLKINGFWAILQPPPLKSSGYFWLFLPPPPRGRDSQPPPVGWVWKPLRHVDPNQIYETTRATRIHGAEQANKVIKNTSTSGKRRMVIQTGGFILKSLRTLGMKSLQNLLLGQGHSAAKISVGAFVSNESDRKLLLRVRVHQVHPPKSGQGSE